MRLIAEEFPAICTGVGFLAGVSPPVRHQVGGTGEPLPALRTGIRPLSRVDSLVFNQVGLVGEAFAAQ